MPAASSGHVAILLLWETTEAGHCPRDVLIILAYYLRSMAIMNAVISQGDM